MKKRLMRSVVLIVLILFCLAAGGCHVGLRFGTYDEPEMYLTGSFSYRAVDITAVEIDWVAGDISLIQSGKSTLSVSENGAELPEDQKLHWMLDGSTLKIKYCSSGFVGEIDTSGKDLVVELPEGVELSINNVSAAITSERLVLSEISLETVSGDVALTELKTHSAELDTVSGAITVKKITADENIECGSTSGMLCLYEINTPELDILSVSGDVKLSVETCEDIDISVTSSEMQLEIPNGFGVTLDFNGVSGDIRTDMDCETKNGCKIFGDGTCQIEVNTVSGDFVIFTNE